MAKRFPGLASTEGCRFAIQDGDLTPGMPAFDVSLGTTATEVSADSKWLREIKHNGYGRSATAITGQPIGFCNTLHA